MRESPEFKLAGDTVAITSEYVATSGGDRHAFATALLAHALQLARMHSEPLSLAEELSRMAGEIAARADVVGSA